LVAHFDADMTRFRQKWFVALLLAFSLVSHASAGDATNRPPSFQEVYDLVRTHLDGVTDAELQRDAVDGLVKQLQPRVQLVTGQSETNSATLGPLLTRSTVYDGPVAYCRIARVSDGLVRDLETVLKELSSTNRLEGLVLDLRFASGGDYAAAAGMADLFASSNRMLLDWGTGVARSSAKADAVKLPVAVLVNRQTSGAAEALAAVLREVGVGLILGANTAGRALLADEFPLKNGQRLRVVRGGIRLGNGEILSPDGVKPDIEVAVSAAAELAYWNDPYAALPAGTNLVAGSTASGTNTLATAIDHIAVRRLNEAELVRERREGLDFSANAEGSGEPNAAPEKPAVRDPVLSRALDLIKGLALVRQMRTP
jgi:hypothetical protein